MGGTQAEADSSDPEGNVGILDVLQQINDYLGLQEKMTVLKQTASDYPITATFLAVTIVMCSVPLFCFFTFVFIFTVFGFSGFVIFEGVVLTLSSVVLIGALFLMTLLSFGFSSFLVIGYYTFTYFWNLLNPMSIGIPIPEFLTSRIPVWTTKQKLT